MNHAAIDVCIARKMLSCLNKCVTDITSNIYQCLIHKHTPGLFDTQETSHTKHNMDVCVKRISIITNHFLVVEVFFT